MITAKIGISNNSDAFNAGKEAAQISKNQIKVPAQLLMASASAPLYDQQKVLDGIKSVFKNTPLVGGSPLGGICSDVKHKDEAVIVAALNFEKTEFKVEVVENLPNRETEAGKELGKKMKKNGKSPKAMVLFPPSIGKGGIILNMDAFLVGLKETLGDQTIIIGTSTGNDNLIAGKMEISESYQYINGEAKTDSATALGLWGDFDYQIVIKHGGEPIGLEAKVTKANGTTLEEIDNQPAVEFYKKYLNKSKKEIMKPDFFSASQDGFLYSIGVIEEGEQITIKQPLTTTPEGGFVMLEPLSAGQKIRIMSVQVDGIEKAGKDAAKEVKEKIHPEFLIVISCVNRKLFIIPDQRKEIAAIQKTVGPAVPIFGLWSAGEIGIHLDQHKWFILNETLIILGIKE